MHPATDSDSAGARPCATSLAGGHVHDLPLCVDLDGTLVATDTLLESLVAALRSWRTVAGLPLAFAKGRYAIKSYLAARVRPDAALLPYNRELVDWLRSERARGRRIVLATAAHERIAHDVSEHLGLFDDVVSTRGGENMKGAAKGAALSARFGDGGFVYAGDHRADIAVWRRAGGAVLVAVQPAVERAVRKAVVVERSFPRRTGTFAAAAKAVRPHQWLKNLLVFVPMLTAGAYRDADAWLRAFATFLAFSLVASCIYVINDLVDLEADRAHARKRARPFASGRLSLSAAPVILATFAVSALPLVMWARETVVIATYAAVSLAYSFRLKELPLVDIFCLAALYTLRLIGGGVATGHPVSLWLMAFSVFLFLSLGTVKRVAELHLHVQKGATSIRRRGYLTSDADFLHTLGIGCGLVSALVLALYLQSDIVASRFATPVWLWPIVAMELYWISSVWLVTLRGKMHDDPIVFAARDRRTFVFALLALACVAAAR
ncbi:MAG TPA: UbiA family prenyltransferase [Gemmatirosa sp.]